MRLSRHCLTTKIRSPPLTIITGEEFTRYAGELYLQKWIRPYVDTSRWEVFDLSCKSRDATDDKVLAAAIESGKKTGAIYKEPTITPTNEQVKSMGLKKSWGSPNGAMRRGWNGYTISRDTIHIEGMNLGYKKPVLFDRHAVGGEYGAAFKTVGPGRVNFQFIPDGSAPIQIDSRVLTDKESALVIYDNPYDSITPMAHHFFARCLEARVVPCVVTKKTVFKWQESFYRKMKEVYDAKFKDAFVGAGIVSSSKSELQHYLSDVATMQLIRWTDGGFGMAAHNYDGDVLTDELAQIHRSPGFLSSVLSGINHDGSIIKEFEASHGTVTDMWNMHQRGEPTSLNPLSMMEALVGAMQHATKLHKGHDDLLAFSKRLQKAIHEQMVVKGTRDIHKDGLTTEQFVDAVTDRLTGKSVASATPRSTVADAGQYDDAAMRALFSSLDTNRDGTIDYKEFVAGIKKLGVAPSVGTKKPM
jgi:isocitrate dehydrogenase